MRYIASRLNVVGVLNHLQMASASKVSKIKKNLAGECELRPINDYDTERLFATGCQTQFPGASLPCGCLDLSTCIPPLLLLAL